MRSDQQQNNERLIRAAAYLFEHSEGSISLADIAKQAEVSVATAYRHFDSVDEALSAYRRDIGFRFRDFSVARQESGLPLMEAVSAFWVDLVLEDGAALVHRRSQEGFLARYRVRKPYMSGQIDALARPLREVVSVLGLADVPDIEDEAAFLWNILFDPREIFDLHETLRLAAPQITRRLFAAFRGALAGWATARMSESFSR
jgi:AcrR family transcriptional regulator